MELKYIQKSSFNRTVWNRNFYPPCSGGVFLFSKTNEKMNQSNVPSANQLHQKAMDLANLAVKDAIDV